MPTQYKVKDWSKFQHFKDRCPPWIKLYRDTLDQRDINLLSDGAFRVLIGLWLLASEDTAKSGQLPSVEDMAFRLRKPKSFVEKALEELNNFVIQNDISVISSGYQLDAPETETETETEGETKTDIPDDKSSKPVREIKQFIFDSWNDSCVTKPHLKPKRKISAATNKKMNARIKEHPEPSDWVDLFQKIQQSPVLGITDDTSWFNFDFIFRNADQFDKIMDGWMDWKVSGKKPEEISETEKARKHAAIVAKVRAAHLREGA